MLQPWVIAYHLIWTAYGWWLPNDIRGSMSRFVASDVLAELGDLHYGRKRVQPTSREIRTFLRDAGERLTFGPLAFCSDAVSVIADAFARVIDTERYTCWACAIMPDHVHVLIRKHKHLAEEMISNLQRESHLALRDAGIRDMEHPVWGGHGWKVFLDTPADVQRTIPYIEENPRKLKRPAQRWPFVKPYDGWPLHPGHDPDSPYAKRLRRS